MTVETVTDIIVARSREPDRLKAMVMWSIVAHVGVVGLILFGPHPQRNDAPRTVMTISLGGAPGPRAGGLTQTGGREVQAPPPEQPVKPVEAPPPPARPAMTVPDPRTSRPESPRKQRPQPTATAEPQEGSTRVETNVRGQGFGLSSGGGGSKGVELDVADFCCPEYLEQMVALIQRNWQTERVAGSTVMKFTILRDGAIQAVVLERSSGLLALDNAANRAVLLTQRLPPLPAPFPNPTLTVHMRFEYQR